MVQQLRIYTPNAGGPGLIPGQGTRSRMPQLKILHAATKKKKKNDTNELIYDIDTDIEKTLVVAKGEGIWGRDELGVWD